VSETEEQKSGGFYGWINILILFFIYGSVYGFIFYGFTVVFPAMISAQGWGRGEAAMAHTLRAFSLGIFVLLLAVAIGKVGAKRTMIAGLFLGIIVMGMLGTVTSQLLALDRSVGNHHAHFIFIRGRHSHPDDGDVLV